MDPSFLLSDEAFARRIAIGLLRDREAADDLVQEAWLEILERTPREVANPRGYLTTLLRRLWFRRRREAERRTKRERASARSETQGDTSALVARAEIHRRTVAAVLALEEPYRSTILLRFYEDRTPADIAAHLGIPEETARTRLKRALAMLRARLEQEGRDWREEWAVALAGAHEWPVPAPVRLATLPALPAWSTVGVAAVVLVAWLARPERPATRARPPGSDGNRVAEAGAPVELPALVPHEGGARVALESEESASAPLAGSFLTGRVRGEDGQPLAGVRVGLAISRFGDGDELALATSDETGSFACALGGWNQLSPVARGLLGLDVRVWKSGHMPLEHEVELHGGHPGELELVLAPGRLLSGRVLGPAGAPVPTLVTVRAGRESSRQSQHELAEPADRDGWFAFGLKEGERVSAVLCSSAAHGFACIAGDALLARTSGDIALGPITLARGHELRGRCIHPDGTPAAGLRLQVREVERDPAGGYRLVKGSALDPLDMADGLTRVPATTDELGRFEVAGLGDGLFQVHDGSGPLANGAAWRSDAADVEIVFARHRALIQVVDSAGRPLEEARVAVTRLTDTGEPAALPHRMITSGTPPVAALAFVPGETLAVLAFAPGCAAVEEPFVLTGESYAPELRLALEPEERRATLVLDPRTGPRAGWRVSLCAPLSGMRLSGSQDLPADAEGRVTGLPLGRYCLRIEPPPAGEGETVPEACLLEAFEPVVLTEGETRFAFAPVPAARLRILFTGAGPDPGTPREPIRDLEAYGASNERYGWMALSMLGARGTLELWSEANASGQPLRRVSDLRPEPGQYLDLVVPARPSRLRLVLPGRESFEREFAPAPGETLELSVDLAEAVPAR